MPESAPSLAHAFSQRDALNKEQHALEARLQATPHTTLGPMATAAHALLFNELNPVCVPSDASFTPGQRHLPSHGLAGSGGSDSYPAGVPYPDSGPLAAGDT